MECADVKAKVEHPPHWHTILHYDGVTVEGQCGGYVNPKCTCLLLFELDDRNPIPDRPLRICPVHQPRLHELRKRIHGYA